MTELSQLILKDYQVRKTQKQKTRFIALMKEHFPQLRVEETRGLFHTRNLILGNPESARVVLSAHYDTCAVLPFPNFLTPLNLPFYLLYQLLIVAVCCLLVWGAQRWVTSMAGEALGLAVALVLFLGVFWLLLFGPANRHTANDNTSGVITLIECYAAMSEEQRQNVCLVFFDLEEAGLIGSSNFRKTHKEAMKDKLLLNFDCVSDGDTFLLVGSRPARERYGEAFTASFLPKEELTTRLVSSSRVLYPSDQAHFPVSAALASFRTIPVLGLYVGRIHTPRDTVFEEENIAYLKEGVLSLLERL